MRVYQTNEIKNIALLGSAGSGKTTLAESMLFEAGIIKRRGSVESKNTVSDYFPVELEYGYSVFPTVFHVEWNNKKLNIIDCPGSDDFIGGGLTFLKIKDQIGRGKECKSGTTINLLTSSACKKKNLQSTAYD